MLRRRTAAAPTTPRPAWQARFDAVVATLRASPLPTWLDDRLVELTAALVDAAADDARLEAAIRQLDPEATTRELKAALRTQRLGDVRSSVDLERRVATLRERHATVHELQNRREALAGRVDAAIGDLEVLAIRSIGSAALAASPASEPVDERIDRLRDDIAALEAARAELAALGLSVPHVGPAPMSATPPLEER